MIRPGMPGSCPGCGGPWGPPWWIGGGPWMRPPWGGPCIGPRCGGPWMGAASADLQSPAVPAMRYMGTQPYWMGRPPMGWHRFGYDMDFDD
jgi:hypothetical protein